MVQIKIVYMKNWGEMNSLEKLRFIGLGICIILFVTLIVQNYQAVTLTLFFWKVKVSLILLILISAALGFLIAFFKDSVRIKTLRKENKLLNGALEAVESSKSSPENPS